MKYIIQNVISGEYVARYIKRKSGYTRNLRDARTFDCPIKAKRMSLGTSEVVIPLESINVE